MVLNPARLICRASQGSLSGRTGSTITAPFIILQLKAQVTMAFIILFPSDAMSQQSLSTERGATCRCAILYNLAAVVSQSLSVRCSFVDERPIFATIRRTTEMRNTPSRFQLPPLTAQFSTCFFTSPARLQPRHRVCDGAVKSRATT